jgi:hypothetical protein
MNKKPLFFGMLVCALALSFALVGCKTEADTPLEIPEGLRGTWKPKTSGYNYTLVITATTAKVTGGSLAGAEYTLTKVDDITGIYTFGDGATEGWKITYRSDTGKVTNVAGVEFGTVSSVPTGYPNWEKQSE